VSPGAIDQDRWEWMKNYRVWQANREVFLYPENWLAPEWRMDGCRLREFPAGAAVQ
jgi:ABC toxin-like protein